MRDHAEIIERLALNSILPTLRWSALGCNLSESEPDGEGPPAHAEQDASGVPGILAKLASLGLITGPKHVAEELDEKDQLLSVHRERLVGRGRPKSLTWQCRPQSRTS